MSTVGKRKASASPAKQDDPPVPPSPFTTTRDVLQKLNSVLASLDDDEIDETNQTRSRSGRDDKPHFELQKKFDNGATRRATEAELKSHDFETKLKQTALHLSNLSSDQDRFEFVQAQVSYGNQLYSSQQYEDAMDVYLTCLAGVEARSDQRLVQLSRILQNLAQCALQLGWYGKCVRFCTIGLEQLQLIGGEGPSTFCNDEINRDDMQEARRQYAAKFFFKRAKAQRLKGMYTDSKRDLKQAEMWIESSLSSPSKNPSSCTNEQLKSIHKEQQMLAKAVKHGREIRQRQQDAMQRILNSSHQETAATTSTSNDSIMKSSQISSLQRGSSSPVISPLYKDAIGDDIAAKRQYSTLRAPSYYSKVNAMDNQRPNDCDELLPSSPEILNSPTRRCWEIVMGVLRSWMGRDEHHRQPSSTNVSTNKLD